MIQAYFKTFKNQGKYEMMLAEKKMVVNFIEKWKIFKKKEKKKEGCMPSGNW